MQLCLRYDLGMSKEIPDKMAIVRSKTSKAGHSARLFTDDFVTGLLDENQMDG